MTAADLFWCWVATMTHRPTVPFVALEGLPDHAVVPAV